MYHHRRIKNNSKQWCYSFVQRMEADNVFAVARKKESTMKRFNRWRRNVERKRLRRFTLQTAKRTVRSLPTQIAESRVSHPMTMWIKIRPVFFWGDLALETRIDNNMFAEYLRSKGFIVR